MSGKDFVMRFLLQRADVLPGKCMRLMRRVPFGGGLYIKIDNNNIALREDEARNIVLEMEEKIEAYL